jgi:hypothetical protein
MKREGQLSALFYILLSLKRRVRTDFQIMARLALYPAFFSLRRKGDPFQLRGNSETSTRSLNKIRFIESNLELGSSRRRERGYEETERYVDSANNRHMVS